MSDMPVSVDAFPDWTPRCLIKIYEVFPLQNSVARRLLSDPRMKSVWNYLLRLPVDNPEQFISKIDRLFRLETYTEDDEVLSPIEQLCVAFYFECVNELANERPYGTRTRAEEWAQPWFDAAEKCKWSAENDVTIRMRPEILSALAAAARYLSEQGTLRRQENNPRVVARSSRDRGDDQVRGRVRALALVTHNLFGSYLYGVLAQAVSVGADLPRALEKKSVENWCANLPRAPN